MNAELHIFQLMLTKGIESKQVIDDNVTSCVVYIDPRTSTFFCGKMKHSPTVERYSFSSFMRVIPEGTNRLTVVFGDATAVPSQLIEGSTDAPFAVFTGLTPPLILEFSSDKVRDYMAKMIPQLMA